MRFLNQPEMANAEEVGWGFDGMTVDGKGCFCDSIRKFAHFHSEEMQGETFKRNKSSDCVREEEGSVIESTRITNIQMNGF